MPLDPQPGRINILQLFIGLVFLVPPALYMLYMIGMLAGGLGSSVSQNRTMAQALLVFMLAILGAPLALGAWLTYTAFPRRDTFRSAAAEGPARWSPLRLVMFAFGLLWLTSAAFRMATGPFVSTMLAMNALTMATGAALIYLALRVRRRT